jgi:diguanylate cyclase (GGDEF)-like protein
MRSTAEQSRLDRVARYDALTGLPNRREFDFVFDREWNRARRSESTLAVFIIDIDHFKLLNDGLGHLAGDDRLRTVACELADCATRSSDFVGRYGGEEFVAIVPGASEDSAVALAEKMRKAVENRAMSSPAPLGIVTVSIGLVCCKVDGRHSAADFVEMADAALYDAKRAGRNRIQIACPLG